jgi:hypothetical protein
MKTRSDVKLGKNEVLEKEVVLEKISLLKSILGVDKILADSQQFAAHL